MTSEPFAAQPVSGVGGGRIVGMEEGQKKLCNGTGWVFVGTEFARECGCRFVMNEGACK